MITDLKWRIILKEIASTLEERFQVDLMIDNYVLAEIEQMVRSSLKSYHLNDPNVPKVAGHISFWIRKLKPLSHAPGSQGVYTAINELASLMVGVSLCRRFGADSVIPPRILKDWATSLRLNSHSPHGTAIAFELITKK